MPNLSTLLVGLAVLAVFVSITARGVYNRKHGKGGCSCGCDHCPSKGPVAIGPPVHTIPSPCSGSCGKCQDCH